MNLLLMTTLFNLFCPVILFLDVIKITGLLLVILSMSMSMMLVSWLNKIMSKISSVFLLSDIMYATVMVFFVLVLANLISLVFYNYPVSTTLGFNFSLAFMLWIPSILMNFIKSKLLSNLLPLNTPWFLISFLSIVEMISLIVRPVTLSFRLLANMSAGHILFTLICKMDSGAWMVGSLFGLLELMVSMVQGFVFVMLVKVYLEETFFH